MLHIALGVCCLVSSSDEWIVRGDYPDVIGYVNILRVRFSGCMGGSLTFSKFACSGSFCRKNCVGFYFLKINREFNQRIVENFTNIENNKND